MTRKVDGGQLGLKVVRVTDRAGQDDFLSVPYGLYRDDANWHPPLRMERREHLEEVLADPMFGDMALFVAYHGEKPVGRIAAFRNHHYDARYGAGQGHFGALDVDPDNEVALKILLYAAEDHLLGIGCREAAGPYSFWIYDEVGLLTEGFDTPDMLMMPHHKEGLGERLSEAGYEPAADLLAYYVGLRDHYPRPPVVQRLCRTVENDPNLRVRQVQKPDFDRELQTAMDIFNDGWSVNWGHVNFPPEKVAKMGESLKPILTPDRFWFGEADGEPVAFVVMLPNVNEAARDLDGKLLPFGWAKLLTRLKLKTPKTSRMALMGLRREHHKSRAGVALVCSLFEAAFAEGRKRGVEGCELSWVLEQNKDVRKLIALSGAEVYKRYQIVTKNLAGQAS
ncbi:hypothetical protein [Parvularcula maris]|uniref:N-acetyltransferase n=1 Tax=Parvularcula maris TaxID=2965077 RepID=A0A9X2RIR7_9PROT|nr:hypothetical protein [Parvularcula maris]MCQ8186329.1 hypothetical protein [Parvularcula maris]